MMTQSSKCRHFTYNNRGQPFVSGNTVIANRELDPSLGPPFVYMKMDIEGSEYETLAAMLYRGALSQINLTTIEYHDLVLTPPMPEKLIKDIKSFKHAMNTILSLGEDLYGMKPMKVRVMDDETHFEDEKPFPEKCL